jgi:hypothetical protein
MRDDEPNPDEGHVDMHNGNTLFWKRNEAGGRTYTSDEIPTGVEVWDTCLTATATLCEAIAMEFALSCMERRDEERAERARPKTTAERFALLAGTDDRAGTTAPGEKIPEGVLAFDGPPPPSLGRFRAEPRPLTHDDVTLRVHLIRARDQLLRYSSEDPMAAELSRLLGESRA